MAFELRPRESVDRGIRRLARKELNSAAKALTDSKANIDDAIYDARKRVKKARAILTLVKTAGGRKLNKDEKRLRRASKELSRFRDADARLEIFDRLRKLSPTLLTKRSLTIARQSLVDSKKDIRKQAGGRKKLTKTARLLAKTARSAQRWRPAHRQFQSLAASLDRLRQKGRKALRRARARGDADDFHALRKIAKAYRYQLRLLAACGGDIRKDVRSVHQLETWLGDDHNVVILCEQLLGNPAIVRACHDLDQLRDAARRYQTALRRQALAQGARIYATDDRRYLKQLKQQWKTWRRRRPAA